MAEGLTLDSGALIAAEKGEKRFWTYWEEALDRRAVVTVPVADPTPAGEIFSQEPRNPGWAEPVGRPPFELLASELREFSPVKALR